jgi:hypothetical protein
MNKISQMKTSNNIYLPFIESYLSWSGLRELSDGIKIPDINKISVYIEKYNHTFFITIDERYNILRINTVVIKKELEIIKVLYDKLKSSNPSYGTINTNNDIEWDPTENIFVEDFFNYLKISNRNQNIDKVINE